MEYKIKGDNFPVLEFTLKKGEKVLTELGCMCWMDPTVTMDTSTNGGIKKMFSRMFTSESLLQNFFIADEDGSKLALGSCVPGSICAIEVKPGHSVICQKSAFLAGFGDLEMSIHFNKKIGVGLFGGEGFIMQKISGSGIVFLEIDGSQIEHELASGEQILISTGFLVSMDESCQIDIQGVKGLKNKLFGGQGLFNTLITGPGKVVTQTMPLPNLVEAMKPYLPQPQVNVSTSSSSSSNN